MIPNSELANDILNKIKSAKNILLHNHPSPDADSVGSALAMRLVLLELDKQVTVIKGDSDKQASFNCLTGYEQVIDQNWFDTDLSKFDLFISLDSASLGQISAKGEVVFPPHLSTIVIDHHGSNTKYADINLVDPSFSSNCQLLYEIFKQWPVTISPDIAKCLLLGIYTDSGGFRYLPTDFRTFQDAADLVKIAPDYNQTISSLYDHNSLGRVKFLGLGLSQLKLYFNNQVAISAIPYQFLVDHQIDVSDTEKSDVANYLKSINGVQIGVILCEKSPKQINISFRSRDAKTFNVADVAIKLGGGGHPAAAATRLSTTPDDALEQTLKALQEVYPNI